MYRIVCACLCILVSLCLSAHPCLSILLSTSVCCVILFALSVVYVCVCYCHSPLSLCRVSLSYIGRGNAWIKLGNVKQAIEDFTEFANRASTSPEPFMLRGLAYYSSGQGQLALDGNALCLCLCLFVLC